MNKKLLRLIGATALWAFSANAALPPPPGASATCISCTINNPAFNGGNVTNGITAPYFGNASGDVRINPSNCTGLKVNADGYGTTFNMTSPHGCASVAFTGAITGTALTTVGGPALVFGQTIAGAGVTAGTVITGGSGDAWTVNNSQTVVSEALTASATAKNNLILRAPNQGETFFQFAVSDSTTPDFESGILIQSNVNGLQLRATSGGGIITQLFNGGSNGMIIWPAGTTNFQSTGGASQVLRQSSTGAAITVGQLATTDLSDNGTYSISTTGSAQFGGNGFITLASVGQPTLGSDPSHTLRIASGIGNNILLSDSVISLGSGQANFVTVSTGAGDPLVATTGGNLVLQAAGTSKIIFKNATNGQAREVFNTGGGNNIRLFTGTTPQINTNTGNLQITSAGGVVQVSGTLKYGTFTASGTCTILGTFAMQDSSGAARTVPYCS